MDTEAKPWSHYAIGSPDYDNELRSKTVWFKDIPTQELLESKNYLTCTEDSSRYQHSHEEFWYSNWYHPEARFCGLSNDDRWWGEEELHLMRPVAVFHCRHCTGTFHQKNLPFYTILSEYIKNKNFFHIQEEKLKPKTYYGQQ